MRAYVSNVDGFFGHNVSRILNQTIVGSRRPREEPDGEGEAIQHTTPKAYTVCGSLTPKPKNDDDYLLCVSKPGPMVECGDKAVDLARRESIERYAVLGQKPVWVKDLISCENQDELKAAVLSADVIVYDIVQSLDEALWVAEFLNAQAETFTENPKTMIAISTVMTWAKTKTDPDDPEAPLIEDDYRRRKAHPNFKNHLEAEKSILKFGKKSSFSTFVIAPGLVYHSGDCIFHYLFKSAWHNEEELTCYGDGTNILPTIHLEDLCNIVVEIIETTPEQKYILAIDDAKSSLFEVTKAVSEAMSSGKVKKAPKEMAFLQRQISQSDFDMLTSSLRLEAGAIKDMTFEWKYESGIIESMPALIQDYKNARGLHPLKVVVLGPPASGKTTLAKKIATHYSTHYIETESVMKEVLETLEKRINAPIPVDQDGEEVEERDIEADKESLAELKDYASKNNGRYPEDQVINFVREKLKATSSRNQGFVLDGYPATTEEANTLFRNADADNGEGPKNDNLLTPEFVIALDCSDDFIKEQLMALPEDQVLGTKNSEEALTKRLDVYHSQNTDDNTVLNYFDELDIHALTINAEANSSEKMLDAFVKHLGRPRNYGPSMEELREKKRGEEEKRERECLASEEERSRKEKDDVEKHIRAVAQWNTRMEDVRKQEKEVLEAQSVPLRNYLMKYVMPTLTSALIDVCKVRPEDPVDYVADFLFKHNPTNA